MAPEARPETYAPASDVVAWIFSSERTTVAEVFVRPEGTFGFRYSSWVAWRDAGNAVRSHSWHEFWPPENLLTDSASEAKSRAEAVLASAGVSVEGTWHDA